MSELKLLNCPFCGGEAEIAYSNDNHKQPYIRCKFGVMENPKCPASNMYQWQFHSLDEAIKAWNTRKPMANIVEKLKERRIEYELSSENAPDAVSSTYRKGVMRGYEYSRDLVNQEINKEN